MINTLELLNGFLNMKMKKGERKGDQIAKIETGFARLAATNDTVSESIRVTILVSSLSSFPEYAAITASINMKNADEVNWNYASMTFIQEQKRQRSQNGLQENVGDAIIVVPCQFLLRRRRRRQGR